MTKQKLFALWRYTFQSFTGIDGYLGGPVGAVDKEGRIKATNYGGGWFNPVKLFPLAEGVKLLAQIKALERAYHTAHRKVDAEFTKKMKELFTP